MPHEKTPFLSVVIPSFNEEKNLREGVLAEVFSFLKDQGFTWEVIVVDDGSTDDSITYLEKRQTTQENFRLLSPPHRGKFFALDSGVHRTKGRAVLLTDMDQSTPLPEVNKLLPFLQQGADIVIGSRGSERKDFPLYRKLASFLFNRFRKSILLPEIDDTQCGFKLMRRDVATELFGNMRDTQTPSRDNRWKVGAWDVEMLFRAVRKGYKVREVNVAWSNRDVSDLKGKKFLRESLEMLREILMVRIKDLQGRYD